MLVITDAIKEKLEYEFKTNLNASAGIFLNVPTFDSIDKVKEYIEWMKRIVVLFIEKKDFKSVQFFLNEIKEYVKILEIFGCEDYSKQTC